MDTVKVNACDIFRVLRGRNILLHWDGDTVTIDAPQGTLTPHIRAFLTGRKPMIQRILQYQLNTNLADLKQKYNALLNKHREYEQICDSVGYPEYKSLIEYSLWKMAAQELTQLANRIKALSGEPMHQSDWLDGFDGFADDAELMVELEHHFGQLQELKKAHD